MKQKRIVSIFLAVLMTASLFACAPASDEPESPNESKALTDVESAVDLASETDAASEAPIETEPESVAEPESEPEPETEAETEAEISVDDMVFNGYFFATGGKVDAETLDSVNCVLLGPGVRSEFEEGMAKAIEEENYFWVYCTFLEGGVKDNVMTLPMLWERKMDALVRQIKEAGAYDLFLGWYMDEPLLNHFTAEQVLEISKYNHDAIGKRFFVCFSLAEFAPEIWSADYITTIMSRDYSTYITDAAYDAYWEINAENRKRYELLNEKLHAVMPEDCRFWYVPWTFTWSEGKTMEQAQKEELILLNNLNAMYQFLKKEENPGGLVSFLWQGKSIGSYGVDEMIDAGYWQKLYARLQTIGDDIVSGKLNKK